jgi:pimeloyl-ACP methyl ester carboxylesterase
MSATPGAITETDVDEFVRTYSRPDGFRGASGLYRSMLREGADIAALAASHPLTVPALAVGAGGGDFTTATLSHAVPGEVRSVTLEGIGHYAAMEAPNELATALLDFFRSVDAS